MGLTNYPNGVSSFGIPIVGGAGPITTGKIFFVSSGIGANAAGRGDSPTNPYATWKYALTQARANKGDVIYILPGHTEDVTSAGRITASIAGVTTIGLGIDTERPKFTFKTVVGATIAVAAANNRFSNLVFDYTGIDAITTGINITAAAAEFYGCKFIMSSSTKQATVAVTLAAGADRAKFIECEVAAADAGATGWISSAVALDSVQVKNCLIKGDFSTAAIVNGTAAWTNVYIARNEFALLNSTAPAISMFTGATGIVRENYAKGLGWGSVNTPYGNLATLLYANNYAFDDASGASGQLCPAAGTLS